MIKSLYKYLSENTELDIVITREPGGSPISERIREVILSHENIGMDPKTEALLFAASRRQHIVDTILPSQEQDKLVISDRFVHSSLVYQGVARDLPVEEVWKINKFAIEDHMPDLTLLLDVNAEVGLTRIHKAKGSRQFDRLDNESLEFHQKVRQAFLDLAKDNPKIKVIDASQEEARVLEDVVKVLEEFARTKEEEK